MVKSLPKDFAILHLSHQITRSGSSAALNYGEVLGAESKKDFIYKLKIVMKELRETLVGLNIIKSTARSLKGSGIDKIIQENNELISIFYKSVETAEENLRKQLIKQS